LRCGQQLAIWPDVNGFSIVLCPPIITRSPSENADDAAAQQQQQQQQKIKLLIPNDCCVRPMASIQPIFGSLIFRREK
jgi:hypothetical protein